MRFKKILLPISFFIVLIQSNSIYARTTDTSINTGLQQFLVGDWCLNKEEYQGEISFSGDIWSFYENGNYEINSSETPYKIIDETIVMNDFATLKVQKISEHEMIAKVHSTYHFSKPRCAEETLHALKITQLNNAILRNKVKTVQRFIDEGVDVSKADLRSGLQSTPLMLAVKEYNIVIVKLLLKQKPDLYIKNYLGKTVLDLIEKESISEQIREMINNANNQ